MTVKPVMGAVDQALRRASQATGVDFGFLLGTARRESGLRPDAKAPTSSAAGLFQFIDQTWLSTLKKHGAKHGYGAYADMITQGPDGRYRVQNNEARAAVMNLRYDPDAAALMAGELASDHADYLRGRLGRSPTGGELYAAHFLGPKGAARLVEGMRANPGASAASLFPEAAAANRSIFYKGGRPVTVAELYGNLTATGGGGAVVGPRETAPTPLGGYLQYAAGGGDQKAQEELMIAMILRGGGLGVGGGLFGGDSAGGGRSLANSLFSAEMLKVLADAKKDQA